MKILGKKKIRELAARVCANYIIAQDAIGKAVVGGAMNVKDGLEGYERLVENTLHAADILGVRDEVMEALFKYIDIRNNEKEQ